MRRPLAWVIGALAAVLLRRRTRPPVVDPVEVTDPRADELRRKLAESREIVEERDEFEAAETTVAEAALRDRDDRADQDADERCQCVGAQPAQRLPPVAALEEDEADGVHPVREIVADDRDEDEQPGRSADMEGEADAESVDEAVDREAGRANRADSGMRPRLLGLVTVVEDEEALRDEEE